MFVDPDQQTRQVDLRQYASLAHVRQGKRLNQAAKRGGHMFYSPFDRCTVCSQYVLLDQTKKECAKEHDCGRTQCPLEPFFAAGYARIPLPAPHPGAREK